MQSLLENLQAPEQGIPEYMNVIKDFYPKEGMSTDSWFFVGSAKTDQHDYGFLLHLMVMQTDDSPRMMKMCYSVTDHQTGFYSATDTTVPLNGDTQSVSVEGDILTVKAGNFWFTGNLEEMRVVGHNDDSAVDVTMKPLGFPILNAGTGYYPIKVVKENYHYSLPYSEMSGSITVNGVTEEITGNCWLDRQYNKFEMSASEKGFVSPGAWLWLGIQVNDGTALSIWDFDDENGIGRTFATLLLPNGKRVVIELKSLMKDSKDVYISPETGRYYPTYWTVTIPEFDINLEIPCFPKNQEIVAAMPSLHKFEGMSSVVGTIKGNTVEGSCMIELSGPWTKEFVDSKQIRY